VNAEGTEALTGADSMRLRVRTAEDGADLLLEVRNVSNHDWPALAGIIPCWSPGRGQAASTGSMYHVPATPQFADPEFNRTFFLSASGLAPLTSRAIHFNGSLRDGVDRASDQGRFVFSTKWPTSDADAAGGLIVRESSEGGWVTGIAWEDYLSVQGHNPWNCMHACVRVGPLARGATRRVRGKAYLFRGDRDACVARFRKDLTEGSGRRE
jgi:hypothetical protein